MGFFAQGARDANKDAIAEDLLRMGAMAQAYYKKPQTIGGGGESFDGIRLGDLGANEIHATYEGASSYSENENGRFVIRSADDTGCVIEGLSQSQDGTDGKPATVRAKVAKADIQLTFVNWD
jgi:hypothetical protein